ncbi:helix-turn-helix transcriptional regulator [Staphylococcus pasteuri]|uniref:helix-turn-helix domain-containing protein n=1 Tax=Staphylococcus pasteuri TaxID=45972 RepID=UPI0030BB9A90
MKFGETLKHHRSLNKISINKLSKLSNVSTTYISKLENGKRSYPTLEIIFNITMGFTLYLEEKFKHLDNYKDYLYLDIDVMLNDFVYCEDSNLSEDIRNNIFDDFIKFMQSKEKKFLSQSFSDTKEIYENKIIMNVGSSSYKKIEQPNFDLMWLLTQNKFEVFYGRNFLLNKNTIDNEQLDTKTMFFYNILDKEDLKTIKKLIDVYLESKYPQIKDPEDFYMLSTDDQNRIKNNLDWFNLD